MGRPRNLTYQQEEFAQHIASGMSQAEAYRKAYPTCLKWPDKAVWSKASVLARHEGVVARIAEIRQPAVARVQEAIVYNVQVAMQEAGEALEMAKKTQQAGSMVAAIQLRAKLNGLITDKKEVAVTQMGDMTPTEKAVLLEAARNALQEKRQLKLPDSDVQDVVPKE